MKKESTKAAGQTNTLKPAERMPYSRGKYIDEANEFLEQCMGGNAYKEALHQGLEGQDTYPYVVARLHLGPDDWNNRHRRFRDDHHRGRRIYNSAGRRSGSRRVCFWCLRSLVIRDAVISGGGIFVNTDAAELTLPAMVDATGNTPMNGDLFLAGNGTISLDSMADNSYLTISAAPFEPYEKTAV